MTKFKLNLIDTSSCNELELIIYVFYFIFYKFKTN